MLLIYLKKEYVNDPYFWYNWYDKMLEAQNITACDCFILEQTTKADDEGRG